MKQSSSARRGWGQLAGCCLRSCTLLSTYFESTNQGRLCEGRLREVQSHNHPITQSLNMDKKEFIRAAITAANGSTYPVGIAVAQAALESAWGASQLSLKANNYFGIKAHGDAG